jgi:hypothetical protein
LKVRNLEIFDMKGSISRMWNTKIFRLKNNTLEIWILTILGIKKLIFDGAKSANFRVKRYYNWYVKLKNTTENTDTNVFPKKRLQIENLSVKFSISAFIEKFLFHFSQFFTEFFKQILKINFRDSNLIMNSTNCNQTLKKEIPKFSTIHKILYFLCKEKFINI